MKRGRGMKAADRYRRQMDEACRGMEGKKDKGSRGAWGKGVKRKRRLGSGNMKGRKKD